jgi:FAD/FMN-containing dehydrogenase
MDDYRSWGKFPKAGTQEVKELYWAQDAGQSFVGGKKVLPRGAGRSQGDVCLNTDGVLLDTRQLNRYIDFNTNTGVITCEAGVTLAEILKISLPQGWFLPVTPGTKYITVGGAVANDVHGKNHHRAGTFGCHVKSFEMIRSSGEKLLCSKEDNTEMFAATIGGMGLTGLILWVELQLKKVESTMIDEEVIKMNSLNDFFVLAKESDKTHDYTVAWLDCQAKGKSLGKGLFMRGNHSQVKTDMSEYKSWIKPKVKWPAASPPGLINKLSVEMFNLGFYHKNLRQKARHTVHFNKFFYPLDGVDSWNRVYGNKGFLQYQFVIPVDGGKEILRTILKKIASSGEASFLSTMKYFGDIKSPGLMSFPRPGLVLATDFINASKKTRKLLTAIDEIVEKSGGAVNPSKDGRMSTKMFRTSFPEWKTFTDYIDPRFSSSFWRRVNKEES